MNPLVSVIIPVYNVKPYLREALNSVIEQNYKRMEIIIVDDGSTDGSENICDEYISDPRVLVIHQENQGLSGARNTGLSLFKGDYLCFLDPDDAYHPAFIERLLENALSTNSEMVACKYIVQRTTGEISTDNRKITQSFPRLASGTYSREEALRNLVEGDLNVFVWNKLYKGNLWNDKYLEDEIVGEMLEVDVTMPYCYNRSKSYPNTYGVCECNYRTIIPNLAMTYTRYDFSDFFPQVDNPDFEMYFYGSYGD